MSPAQRRKRLAELRARSDAAKRGWITRRLNQHLGEQPLEGNLTITRLKYKPKKGGRVVHIEVTRRGTRIVDVRIGNRSYSTPSDIASLSSLLASAEPDDDWSS